MVAPMWWRMGVLRESLDEEDALTIARACQPASPGQTAHGPPVGRSCRQGFTSIGSFGFRPNPLYPSAIGLGPILQAITKGHGHDGQTQIDF